MRETFAVTEGDYLTLPYDFRERRLGDVSQVHVIGSGPDVTVAFFLERGSTIEVVRIPTGVWFEAEPERRSYDRNGVYLGRVARHAIAGGVDEELDVETFRWPDGPHDKGSQDL